MRNDHTQKSWTYTRGEIHTWVTCGKGSAENGAKLRTRHRQSTIAIQGLRSIFDMCV
jgi:hypothetical protein